MLHLGKARRRRCANFLGRRIRALQRRAALFDRLVALDQRVEGRIADLRRILLVIERAVMPDLHGEAREFFLHYGFGQFGDRF